MWLSDHTGMIMDKDKWHDSAVSSVQFCVNYLSEQIPKSLDKKLG